MALSPTGIALDWDCSSALEALLAEDVTDSESAPTELRAGGPTGDNSPLYSPFSDVGSTHSADSGFVAPLVNEEDRLLAGLFGPDCPLLSEPSSSTTSTASLSLSPPASSSFLQLSGGGVPGGSATPTSTVLAPIRQNRQQQRSMFEYDCRLDLDSPSPPPPTTRSDTNKSTVLDKSRKNAEAARQNRLKKKKYMEDLEKDRSRLKAENVVVKTRCAELQAKYKKLETEVAYLRSVLANQSVLATLIKNIPDTPGVNLTSSFSRKRAAETDAAVSTTAIKRPRNASGGGNLCHSGGVCLHVSKDNVSLEFCSQCSLKAAQV